MSCYYSLGLFLAIGIILVNSECVDKPECSRLGYEICSDPNYTKFVIENCCKYCSSNKVKVQTTSSVTTVSDAATTWMDCVDSDPQCGQLGHDVCTEPLFVEWALQKCRKTCGLCNGLPSTTPSITTSPVVTVHTTIKPPPTPACVDKAPNCDSYSLNDCINYGAWAKDNCAKYCSLCGGR
ncbi:hypothetical protein LOTGIDRAFT_163524 [Lottia gigantea]|uniref:ShKT domain-containing protein n=1 Tax=Lottia gigantea TaxID=225164 RepID=V3ZIA5_LOTGI|nr:hypothetical protein LOTGIDRAFT_163524 [Lottia gigantea]ESO91008.1 hypothetical protein LOTGIDRAFT_163524 [Lottia gigantea]